MAEALRSFITDVRKNVWAAIDEYPGLKGQFKEKYKFYGGQRVQQFPPSPGLGDLPAILIFPQPSTDGWQTNQMRRTGYTLGVTIWVNTDELPRAEYLWEHCVRAVFQQRPHGENQVEYWRLNGFVSNVTIGGFAMALANLDPGDDNSPPILTINFPITLDLNWNPRTVAG